MELSGWRLFHWHSFRTIQHCYRLHWATSFPLSKNLSRHTHTHAHANMAMLWWLATSSRPTFCGPRFLTTVSTFPPLYILKPRCQTQAVDQSVVVCNTCELHCCMLLVKWLILFLATFGFRTRFLQAKPFVAVNQHIHFSGSYVALAVCEHL